MNLKKQKIVQLMTKATLLTVMLHLLPATALSYDVMVNVTPVQKVLPPHVLLYINDPGKFFTVTLTNTSQQQQDVYLALDIRQTLPASGLCIGTPPRRQPSKPISIPANGTLQLSSYEIKTLFNHIPSNEITGTEGLFNDYRNGSFALLPEGEYEAQLTAYQWASPQLADPVPVSNSTMGSALFTVCYKAQAPQFLQPAVNSLDLQDNSVAEIDPLNATFVWTSPLIACNPATQFMYSIKIVQVDPGQSPEYALDYNPVVYSSRRMLQAPQFTIPSFDIDTKFYTDKIYAAQVTAVSASSDIMKYVMIENNGKSSYRLFKIKTSDMGDADDDGKDTLLDDEKDKGKEGDGDKDDDKNEDEKEPYIIWGDDELSGLISTDSLYTFSLPVITRPAFAEKDGCRKLFLGNSLKVEWIPSMFRGGEGEDPYSIKFEYDVEVFRGGQVADIEGALATEPVYRRRVSEETDSIPWEKIKDVVENGTYMVVRVTPVVEKGLSVAFTGEDTNIKDFALVELLTKKYFQCSDMVEINNTTPTKLSASQLKSTTVGIGQYQLTIDEISKGAKADTWKGRGHVLWQPFGFDVHVCVEFDDLKINTDNIVFEGSANTYGKSGVPMQASDKLFSDWGIDNLISETGLKSAKDLQPSQTGQVKNIAQQVQIDDYYNYVTTHKTELEDLLSGTVKDLYMPVSMPSVIKNNSPVDIQIVGMKFSPTSATMNVLGEFQLPNSRYTDNKTLLLGAPRLCISPDRFLPESGTLALLSDFTVKDPNTTYTMTFKAPENVIEPSNGCYVSWHADEFELLGIDVDMTIPGLVKDVDGAPSNQPAVLSFTTTIESWDEFLVNKIKMPNFQVEALPGYTFTAEDIVFDHHSFLNADNMASLPKDYDKKAANVQSVVVRDGDYYQVEGDGNWQGVYIRKIGAKFPGALEFGDKGDKRLEVDLNNMYIDASGVTLTAEVINGFSAKTGKCGGWEITLDTVRVNVMQNQFKDCGFAGKFSVPLLKGKVGYSCQILHLTNDPAKSGQYAYVFTTRQVDNLSLDFLMAKADFEQKQSYFLVEASPNNAGKLETKVELMLGGKLDISIDDKLKVKLPDIHFCGMRLANCPDTWVSKYRADMQKEARNANVKKGLKLFSMKEADVSGGLKKLFFGMGKWSLASAEKELGPFKFTLNDFGFDFNSSQKVLKLKVDGTVGLLDGVEVLKAGGGISIKAKVTPPSDWSNLKDISISYGGIEFNSFHIGANFADMVLEGNLKVVNDDTREGFKGDVTIQMPGNLFTLKTNGGYFKNKSGSSYKYGWFYADASAQVGIPCPPVQIDKIKAGFYFNCKRDPIDETNAIPEKGLIGIIAGLGVSTISSPELLSGQFTLTVVFDWEHPRLTDFIMQGTVDAISMIHAKANLCYHNDNKSKYLEVDVTVDATADTAALIKAAGIESAVGDLKKKLNSEYQGLTKLVPKDGLKGKIDDEQTSGTVDTEAPQNGENLCASAGATVNVNFKVTFKENGKNLSPVKWHVWLGQPDLEHRCTFTYLKMKSSIVSCDIGANGYVCVGNELPNNGQLPPIPAKISTFLNGSVQENIESADVATANNARTNSLNAFNKAAETNGGGVMFGGQVYGYFDVNLGVFYINAGATAGFDISIIKLGPEQGCVNFPGTPGYKGWYGSGQLYAYLYAKFGVKIDLGFWEKQFNILDAGIGGVFRMQAPRPSNFEGKARVKLRALEGLVDIDKRYSFSCGDACDLFMGNALDDFEVFGDLSIGSDKKDEGWSDDNKISPTLLSRPVLHTQCALNEHFRVLDPTELERLKKNYTGNEIDALEMEANRTFIFRPDYAGRVVLKEYEKKNQRPSKPTSTRTFYMDDIDRFDHVLDITELNPNSYYSMELMVYAKELIKGKEVHPLKYNKSRNVYENVEWSQKKTYYFATNASTTIPAVPDLQDFIAIAYPSDKNKINSDEVIIAHGNDVMNPTFALTTNLKDKAYKTNSGQTLIWELSNTVYDSKIRGSRKDVVSKSNNKWVVTDSTCNMQPASPLTGFVYGKQYDLTLTYTRSVWDPVTRRTKTETTVLAKMKVKPQNDTWKNSKADGSEYDTNWGSDYRSLPYEKPFVGCRIDKVNFQNDVTSLRASNYEIAHDDKSLGGYKLKLYDPYIYISYLSNWAFIGGWHLKATDMGIDITTSESLVYTDKGGLFEGRLDAKNGNTYRIMDSYNAIKSLSIYDRSQWEKTTLYPLPVIEESEYSYALSGQRRAAVYHPSNNYAQRVRDYLLDMCAVYLNARSLSEQIQYQAKWIEEKQNEKKSWSDKVAKVKEWYDFGHRGHYLVAEDYDAVSMIPYYQFPILWGGCLDNKEGVRHRMTMWGTIQDYELKNKDYKYARGHEEISEYIWSSMLGRGNILTNGSSNKVFDHENYISGFAEFRPDDTTLGRMTSATFTSYRVNAYDFKDCQYTVVDNVSGIKVNGGNATESFTISSPLIKFKSLKPYDGIGDMGTQLGLTYTNTPVYQDVKASAAAAAASTKDKDSSTKDKDSSSGSKAGTSTGSKTGTLFGSKTGTSSGSKLIVPSGFKPVGSSSTGSKTGTSSSSTGSKTGTSSSSTSSGSSSTGTTFKEVKTSYAAGAASATNIKK